jgi:regulator of sigma E protease
MVAQPPAIWLIVLAFVAMIGPLVFFHELGHYLVARWFKVPAETFSIGFGREIIGWTDRRGTRWKIGWLPLGGYVKFVGDMNPASATTDIDNIPEDLRDRAFQFKPVWQRFLIVLAGPAANFLLAIAIFTAFFALVGVPRSNIIGTIKPNSAAAAAGLQSGDRILSLADRETPTFDDVRMVVMLRPNETIPAIIERDGRIRQFSLTLSSEEIENSNGRNIKRGLLGVYPTTKVMAPVPLVQAVPMALTYTASVTRSIVDGIIQIFRGRVSAQEIGGPITIATAAGQAVAIDPLALVGLAAYFSINLGFINLLPVPVLDGGHLFFYSIEAVRRRPLSERAMEWSFRGGLAAVLALLVFSTFNDLGSIGLWDRLQRLIG